MCCRRRDRRQTRLHRSLVFCFRASPLCKKQERHNAFPAFWSKWRDSNSRHPAPKGRLELFSNIFRSFLAPFIPESMLFETLVSTVSVYSKTGYGQKCGQNQPHPGSRLNRGVVCFLRCGDCSLENENRQVLSVPKTAPL